ncbi:MAG: hypothetical protein AB1458_10305 [Bacteroidota bacterium]
MTDLLTRFMDNDTSGPVVAIILMALFLVLIIWLAVWLVRRQNKKAWLQVGQLADAMGIPFEGRDDKKNYRHYPSLNGLYQRRKVSIHSETRGSGKSKHVVTILRVYCNTHGSNTLTVWKEGFFSKIGKAFGMQDIQTGWSDFDKAFVLRSNNPDFALRLFNQGVCNKFLDTAPFIWANIYFNNNCFEYAETSLILNEKIRIRYLNVCELLVYLSEKSENLPRA